MVVAGVIEFTKSATLAVIIQPLFVITRSSVTDILGNTPVVVDLLFTKVGVPNTAAALAGTDRDNVPSCAAIVFADMATDPEPTGAGVGLDAGWSAVAAAVKAPDVDVMVIVR